MHSKFLNLNEEKQQRIINAAINEFEHNGYTNASTNEIVKEAEISKGILFHYFKNKSQLFLFLYDYCMEQVLKDVYEKIDFDERDIIVRLRQTSFIKFELMRKYPAIFKFIQKAYIEDSVEVKEALEQRNKELVKSSYAKIFENIDKTKFKPGIDVDKAINIIVWTFESFAFSELDKVKRIPFYAIDYDKLFLEGEEYIEILKKSFYI
jgi:TetR/AcrR family transcriptional regulator